MRNLPRDKCIRCEREFAAIRARRLRVIDAMMDGAHGVRLRTLVDRWLLELGRA